MSIHHYFCEIYYFGRVVFLGAWGTEYMRQQVSEQRLRANSIDLNTRIWSAFGRSLSVFGGHGSHGDKSSSVIKYEINNIVTRICSDCKV